MDLQGLYQRRFTPDIDFRNKMWGVLCEKYFQRYISTNDVILEIGAGYCEFINNIHGKIKIAVDINPDIKKFANNSVKVILSQSDHIDGIANDSIDIVFISNFLEHLERKAILGTIQEAYRILRTDGKIIILQPNIRYTYRDYWMFFDHITPIDDRALVEILEINQFKIIEKVIKFLPFTTKSNFPRSIFLIRLYLTMRIVWPLFGKQSLIIAAKPLA